MSRKVMLFVILGIVATLAVAIGITLAYGQTEEGPSEITQPVEVEPGCICKGINLSCEDGRQVAEEGNPHFALNRTKLLGDCMLWTERHQRICLRLSYTFFTSSTEASSSRVVRSPGLCPEATALRTRRMILPLLVLGSDPTK